MSRNSEEMRQWLTTSAGISFRRFFRGLRLSDEDFLHWMEALHIIGEMQMQTPDLRFRLNVIGSLTPGEIRDAVVFKQKQKWSYHTGGRKSRILRLVRELETYDQPYEAGKQYLFDVFHPSYARSTIYKALAQYYHPHP